MKTQKTLQDEYLAPLRNAFNSTEVKKRKSEKISDWDHLYLGVKRCMNHFASGRCFVQKIIDTTKDIPIKLAAYFKCNQSPRRLSMVKKVNEVLIKNYTSPIDDDPFARLACLDRYGIHAADGHYQAHAAHDKHSNGKHYPVGHVFAVNLRDQTVNHLDVTRPEDKKENEIRLLKRLGKDSLRMGEPKGRKVIIVYDRAVVDFLQWYKWKQGSGIYIVTREKSNMKLQRLGDMEFDLSEPVNNGIISDEQVGTSKQTLIRKIRYYDSKSGKEFSFITNVFDVPPGVIAYIYKKRWEVEKIYDTFKNYFFEKKAWGKTDAAKCQQALFMCITHNLNLMLERKIEDEEGIRDEKVIDKKIKRKTELIKKISEDNKPVNPLAVKTDRSVQRSKQFLRYLNNKISINSYWSEFIEGLRPYMVKYLC